jgi:hypothetical protein
VLPDTGFLRIKDICGDIKVSPLCVFLTRLYCRFLKKLNVYAQSLLKRYSGNWRPMEMTTQPNEMQLQRLFEVLRYRLPLKWKARFIDVVPGGELVIVFEQTTNPQWRLWYTIYPNGEFSEREFYA